MYYAGNIRRPVIPEAQMNHYCIRSGTRKLLVEKPAYLVPVRPVVLIVLEKPPAVYSLARIVFVKIRLVTPIVLVEIAYDCLWLLGILHATALR
jgi:hypothetical protein